MRECKDKVGTVFRQRKELGKAWSLLKQFFLAWKGDRTSGVPGHRPTLCHSPRDIQCLGYFCSLKKAYLGSEKRLADSFVDVQRGILKWSLRTTCLKTALVCCFVLKLSPQSTIYLMSCSLLFWSNCASLGYWEVFPFIPNTVVCMYIQVCKCFCGRCSHVCLSMGKIRGQCRMSPSFTLPLVFWYKVLHWMWSLLQLHPWASKPQRFFCVCHSHDRITGLDHWN